MHGECSICDYDRVNVWRIGGRDRVPVFRDRPTDVLLNILLLRCCTAISAPSVYIVDSGANCSAILLYGPEKILYLV